MIKNNYDVRLIKNGRGLDYKMMTYFKIGVYKAYTQRNKLSPFYLTALD